MVDRGAQKTANFGQVGGRRCANFGSFWSAESATLGPRDGRFWPILAIFQAPRRAIAVTLGTLTRAILVDTGAQKRSMLSKLEAVGGPILVHFGPSRQPLWAPRRPIYANLAQFWGAKMPEFGQTLNAN